MTHQHKHKHTEKFLALPLNQQLIRFKKIRERIIMSDDMHLLECIDYDIEETKRKLHQQMLDDAVVIYKLDHQRHE